MRRPRIRHRAERCVPVDAAIALQLVRDAAGTPRYERVTDEGNGKDAWPMWSGDGRTVYYVSDRGGQENLWAKPLAGAAAG